MYLSAAGAAFIKQQEGPRLLSPQPDPGQFGGTVIGWGHYYPAGTPTSQIPTSISATQAETFFQSDVTTASQAVSQSLTVPVTQQAFDGLVDYAYNRGAQNYQNSGVAEAINGGSLQAAATIIKSTGLGCNNPSLIKRRNLEATLLTGNATVRNGVYSFP